MLRIPGQYVVDVRPFALPAALSLYQECLAVNRDDQGLENALWSLAGLAVIAAQEHVPQGAQLLALTERFRQLPGASLTPRILHDHVPALDKLMGAVGAERFAAMRSTVRNTDPAVGVAAALVRTRPGTLSDAPIHAGPGLTPRERNVLRMMAPGRSNQDIADALFVRVGTVKVHVTHYPHPREARSDVERRRRGRRPPAPPRLTRWQPDRQRPWLRRERGVGIGLRAPQIERRSD